MDHRPSGLHVKVRGNERLEALISESETHCIVTLFFFKRDFQRVSNDTVIKRVAVIYLFTYSIQNLKPLVFF